MGKFLIFSRIKLKFRFWLYKKRSHTSWKFQLEKTSNKTINHQKAFDKLTCNEHYIVFQLWYDAGYIIVELFFVFTEIIFLA